MKLVSVLPVLLPALLLTAGCSTYPTRQTQRAGRLMELAAVEAGAVEAPRERLSRQLNIADMQIRHGRRADGQRTLADTAGTLGAEGEAMDDHTRLAGWVSISELARAARQESMAVSACARAEQHLRRLAPAARCPYVCDLALEVRHLHGPDTAAALLRESGEWAAQIEDRTERRAAYFDIAAALFDCDDFDGGQAVLRRDDDPAWRSDALVKMVRGKLPGGYSKSLSFGANFRLSG